LGDRQEERIKRTTTRNDDEPILCFFRIVLVVVLVIGRFALEAKAGQGGSATAL
jgi:hypothetical protein